MLRMMYCLQGVEFESVVQQLVEALSKLGEAESVQGVYTWCRDVVGRKFTWIKAAVEKAYGRLVDFLLL